MAHITENQNSEEKKSTHSMEEALIASEIRYRRLFESAKDGILILDAETGMIDDVNPFLIQLLGFSREDYLKKAIWEIGFFKDIIDNKEKFLEFQQKEYVRYEDLPLETSDGYKIHVEFVSNVYLEDNKKVIQCNIRDITKRRRSEEVLRQKTALLEAQLNSSIDGIIIDDSNGKKILQNQRAIDLWKIPQHIADNEDDNLLVQHVMHMTKNPEMFVKKITDLYEHPDIKSFDEVELVDGTVLERYSVPVLDKYGQNFGRIWIFHDITERKQADDALRKTETFLQTVLSNAPITIFTIDTHRQFTLSEGKGLERVGLKPGDNVGVSAHELYDSITFVNNKDEVITGKDIIRRAFEGETINAINKLNGIWFDNYIGPMHDAEGKIVGIVGVATDITDHKKAVEALQKSEAKHKSMIANIGDVIGVIGSDGILTYKSPNSERWFGWKPEDLVGTNGWDKVHPEDIERVQKEFSVLLEKDNALKTVELRYKCKDDSYKLVELTASNNINDPFIKGILLNYHDISERKHFEEQVLEQKRFFEQVFSQSSVSTQILDKEGWCEKINPKLSEIFGVKPEAIEGKVYNILKDESIRQGGILPLLDKVFNEGKSVEWDINFDIGLAADSQNIEVADKKKVWFHNWAYPIFNDEGHLIHVIIQHSDITERKHAEEALKRSGAQLKEAQKIGKIGNWEFDIATQQIFWSEELYNLFGRDPMQGPPNYGETMAYYVPEDSRKMQDQVRRAIENGEIYDDDYQLKLPSGQLAYQHVRVKIVKEENGRVTKLLGIAQDITERKHLENILQSSKDLLFSIVENSPVRIFWKDRDLRYNGCNSLFANDAGLSSQDQLIGKTDFDMTWKDQAELYQTDDKAVMDSGKPKLEFEEPQTTPQGNTIWLRTSKVPLLDINKKVIGLLGIYQDITAYKLTEETLKESEKFLRETQKIANLGSYKLDIKSGTWQSSELLDIIFGIKPDFDKTVKGWKSIIHPDWRQEMFDYLSNKVIRLNNKFNKEYKIIRENDKSERWVHGMGELVLNKEKQPTHLVGTIRDITERKRTEIALRESEEKYRTLITQSPDGIFVVDLEGNFQSANKVMWQQFNLTEEKLLSMNIWDFIPGKYKEQFEIRLKRIIRRESLSEAVEYEVIGLDGNTIYVEVLSAPFYKENDLIGIQGIARNVTERKIAEKELIKAKEKAEESDRLKTAFLTNMSHEIRTPMNGILGFAELLKEPNLSSDDLQDYIKIIQASGARMLSTINDIVDISKIESGLIQVEMKETNINEIIEFTYNFFKPEAEIKKLQLSFKNGLQSKESIIETDNKKVLGILFSLVKNANKFTHEGSIELGYEKKGEYLEFFVKDTGIGVKQNQKEIIFERFRQVSESDIRGYEGSGLGLSIAKSYVKMLGGEIWVESGEGRGSTFYFTIPYNPVFEEKTVIENTFSENNAEVQLKKLKVLIVEDDEISHLLLSRMLQNINCEVLHAITGVEAVDACRTNPDLDLVLMDIRMPGMDGNEATRQIRQFNKEVIIIAQTAFAFSGDKEKAIEAGCNSYITKPINKDLLTELVRSYFN